MTASKKTATTFTAVIPARNAEGFLQRSVESVLGQTRPPEEIIVVDDGSEDNTLTVARQFEPEVVVLAIPHSGSSAARNAATAVAKSEFIAYLDADDVWVPEKLERFERVISFLDSPSTLISDFRRRVHETGEWRPLSNTDIFPLIMSEKGDQEGFEGVPFRVFDPVTGFSLLLKGYPVWPSTLVVRKEALEAVGGWRSQFIRAQDFDIMLRLASYDGMTYLHAPLSTIYQNEGHGPLSDYVSEQLDWDLRVLRSHAGKSSELGRPQRTMVRRALGERTVYRGDHSRRYDDRLGALSWYVRALAFPRQWLRGSARILETILFIDKIREDESAKLEQLVCEPESEATSSSQGF